MTLALPLILLASVANSPAATSVGYQVDASMLQVDSFTKLNPIGETNVKPATSRSVGLGKLRLGIDFQTGQEGLLTLIFRPDAANRSLNSDNANSREIDTRAGEAYRLSPSLRLLDAYQLHVYRSGSLDLALGVWENMAQDLTVYKDPLDFGLEVRLPSKFSGAALGWTHSTQALGLMHASLRIYQGDEDRVESLGRSDEQFEQAPIAKDSIQALALDMELHPSQTWTVGIVGGYGDSPDFGGRRSEQFLQFVTHWNSFINKKNMRLTLDARQSEERWNKTNTRVAPRIQKSASLTTAYTIFPNHTVLTGFSLGSSQHAKDDKILDQVRTFQGWQVEAGYQTEISQSLFIKLMLDLERRRLKMPGASESGGFSVEDHRRSTNRRIGLEINYNIHGSV